MSEINEFDNDEKPTIKLDQAPELPPTARNTQRLEPVRTREHLWKLDPKRSQPRPHAEPRFIPRPPLFDPSRVCPECDAEMSLAHMNVTGKIADPNDTTWLAARNHLEFVALICPACRFTKFYVY